jgi:hypothetical protein
MLSGSTVVTVSDRLRVRSEPRVSDDSIKYSPVLPLGTMLTVLEGPADGSGYTWYRVRPVSFTGLSGPGDGWVAIASKDGEWWVRPLPAPVLEYVGAEEDYVGSDGQPYTRYLLKIANWESYPAEMFTPAPDLPPCGLNDNAARTWAEIYDAGTDRYVYGFCAFAEPRSLAELWFAVLDGTESPAAVYVTLRDRRVDLVLRSNTVTMPGTPAS